ncbi:MAG: PspA/IM30 family protein [Chloroflexota bacterium]|nr:PspA/IM30 family protein [Chloroflexota bacterium]
MSLLERVTSLVRANINDMLDKAEDPEKMIKQYLIDMHNQLIQVKTQVAAAMADEQKLYERYLDAQNQATEWQRKAELAVQKGSDDLAKEALARRNSFQETADGFKAQYDEQRKEVELLKESLSKLEAKIQEAETKKDLLIARAHVADTQQMVSATQDRLGGAAAFEGFERMEDKVRQKEAMAKASADLEHDSLEEKFQALEKDDNLEAQLAELKQKVHGGESGSSGSQPGA